MGKIKMGFVLLIALIVLFTFAGCRKQPLSPFHSSEFTQENNEKVTNQQTEEKQIVDDQAARDILTEALDNGLKRDFLRVHIYGEDFDYEGEFQKDQWTLDGKTNGTPVTIKKDLESMTVQLDKQAPQPVYPEGWGIFSPKQHMKIIKEHMALTQLLSPITIQGKAYSGALVKIPESAFAKMIQAYLGSQFKDKKQIDKAAEQIKVHYLLWYDNEISRLKQMVVVLKYSSDQGQDHYDSIQFVFGE